MYSWRAARTARTTRSTTANALASSNSTIPTVCVSACLFSNRYCSSAPYSLRHSRSAGMPRSLTTLSIAASL